MCSEAKGNDTVLVSLVDGRELLRNLVLGHVWQRGMDNVNDKLAASQESVGDEFAGANSDGC